MNSFHFAKTSFFCSLEIHLVNLGIGNVVLPGQLFGKEDIHSMDKTSIMGTDYARLSLKTQATLRSVVANLPSDVQVRILQSIQNRTNLTNNMTGFNENENFIRNIYL